MQPPQPTESFGNVLPADHVSPVQKQPRRVFIITPFAPERQAIQDTIRKTVMDAGMIAIVPPGEITGASLAEHIGNCIRSADLIIADISQNSKRFNPNIYFELGYAHALRKPTIIVCDRESDYGMPSDLAGYFVVYNRSNLEFLAEEIKTELRLISASKVWSIS